MKKSLALLLGVLAPCVLLIGACGDDVIDAGGDDDTDADASTRQDATPIPKPDARPDAKPPVPDAKPDVDVPDGDGGPVSDPVKTFADALVTAACAKYASCCAGDPNVPPAGPGKKTCAASAAVDRGFFNGLLDAYYYNPRVATGKRVVIDAQKAAACLSDVAAVGCLDEGVEATVWKKLLQDCGTVLAGTGIEDEECYSDLECTTEFACIGAGLGEGGAAGACKPLRASGETYRNSAQYYGDSCSYRGFGITTGRRNQKTAEDGGTEVCLPQQATGQQCAPFTVEGDYFGTDYDCESYACSISDDFARNECRTKKTDFLYCAQYVIP